MADLTSHSAPHLSGSGFTNIKDTFFLKSFDPLQPPDNESESSSYRELNKTEQHALSRSFRAIQPSQLGATGITTAGDQDDMAHPYDWQPSAAIQQEITGISSPARTRDWPDSGIETTQLEGDAVQLIAPQTRESTPDSTGFSNQLTIMNDERRAGQATGRPVNARQVQLQVDNTRSEGANRMADPPDITPDLSRTTRAMISQMNEISPREPVAAPPPKHDFDTQIPEKQVFPCLPRCLLFALGAMILLGGVVAAVVVFKENKPQALHGDIIPNIITEDECADVRLNLGDPVVIVCTFDIDHEHRKQMPTTKRILVDSPNQLSQSNFNFTTNPPANDQWFITGPVVRCTSVGRYTLTFIDGNNKTLFTGSTTLTVKAGGITGSMTQKLVDYYGTTTFSASCFISKDCHNYDVDFVGRSVSYGRFSTLNEKKVCSTSYADDTGHSISCKTEWEGDVVDKYSSFVGCRMTDIPHTLLHEFKLPSCFKTEECSFNCSKKAPERIQLNNAKCENNRMRRCFPEDRPIWAYRICPQNQTVDCNNYYKDYECRLGWCRSPTGVIYKNEVVGVLVCPEDFELKQPELTTTTTQATTTTTKQQLSTEQQLSTDSPN